MTQRYGILLTNTGSPDLPTADAVSVYLREFLSDGRICPMNPRIWNVILNLFILPKRSPRSAEKYSRIWTEAGSPLIATTSSLARKLGVELSCAERLIDEDEPPYVAFAMNYGNPSLSSVLFEMREARCTHLIVIPMYPQAAFSTTLAAKEKLMETLGMMDWHPMLDIVEDYWTFSSYIECIAEAVRDKGFAPDADRLLFVFHSIPMADVSAGDVYGVSTRSTAERVARVLGVPEGFWSVGYESRFDNARMWLDPFVEQAASDLCGRHADNAGDGASARLFVVAPNFSIDCLETHIDIEEELRGFCIDGGIVESGENFIYVPCLNDTDAHVKLMLELARSCVV